MRIPILAFQGAALALSMAVACDGLKSGAQQPGSGLDATSDGFDHADDGADTQSRDATGQEQVDGESEPDLSEHGMLAMDAGDSTVDSSSDAVQDSDSEARADSDAGDARGDSDANAMARPTDVDPSHLRLWLRADVGVACMPVQGQEGGAVSRVVSWSDQSGHHNDASLRQVPPQLGPQCHVPQHAAGGIDLPYFSAPNNGNVVDETLDVDLGFLVGSDYTIFAVERRWADYGADASSESEYVVGTTVPMAVELAGISSWCNPRPANEVLGFGYVYYSATSAIEAGTPQLIMLQGCGAVSGATAAVPTPPPGALTQETGLLDRLAGRELWIKGVPIAVDTSTPLLTYAAGGAIGRAITVTTALGVDNRFRGDIAEVVVYDAALTSADRASVEAYLKTHWGY